MGPAPGYPFELSITAHYRLDDDGLHSSVTASQLRRRRRARTACARTPIWSPARRRWMSGPWSPGRVFLEVTPDRLLPLPYGAVEGHEFDFRAPRAIGATEIDHAFTDIAFDGGRQAR